MAELRNHTKEGLWRDKHLGGTEVVNLPKFCASSYINLTLEPSGELKVSSRAPATLSTARRRWQSRDGKHKTVAALVNSLKVRDRYRVVPGSNDIPRNIAFTSYSRRLIKNGISVLKRLYGKKNYFGTITLLGSTQAAALLLSQISDRVVDRLSHWIGEHAPGANWVLVWELQKRGALHCHFVVGHKSEALLERLSKDFRNYVHRMYCEISDKYGIDMFANDKGQSWRLNPEVLKNELVVVDKCVKRYMSKYLSKGVEGRQGYCPRSWVGLSKQVRQLVRAYRRSSRRAFSVWAEQQQRLSALRKVVAQAEYVSFSYVNTYEAGSAYMLVFPPEDDSGLLFEYMSRLLA